MNDTHPPIMEETKVFQDEFQQTIQEGQKFCFVSRAKEFQLQAREGLENLSTKVTSLKIKAIAAAYEDAANLLLSYEEITNAIINELSMWIALKEDNPSAAWDYLVKAEFSSNFSDASP